MEIIRNSHSSVFVILNGNFRIFTFQNGYLDNRPSSKMDEPSRNGSMSSTKEQERSCQDCDFCCISGRCGTKDECINRLALILSVAAVTLIILAAIVIYVCCTCRCSKTESKQIQYEPRKKKKDLYVIH